MLHFFFSSRRRHTRSLCDWSSDVCSSDLGTLRMTVPTSFGRYFFGDIFAEYGRRYPEVRLDIRRSEERRVGKECRSPRWPYDSKKKQQRHMRQLAVLQRTSTDQRRTDTCG